MKGKILFMNILITGGAGYVGSACLRYLHAKGHHVVAYDNLVQGHRPAVGNAEFIEGKVGPQQIVIITKYVKKI